MGTKTGIVRLTGILCLALIVFIVLRKFPRLRTLDVETVPGEQLARVREKILLERMKRQQRKSAKWLSRFLKPLGALIKRAIRKLFRKVYALEKKYQREAVAKGQPLTREEIKKQIQNLLAVAEDQVKKEAYREAEKTLIEVVSLDFKNLEAYKGLVAVYLKLKEHKQALQTAQFVLKLAKRPESSGASQELSGAYKGLGDIYQLLSKPQEALKNYQAALALEPNNPRQIDKIIEISIMLKNKILAVEMLKRLETVNPDNQKLKEYQDKINDLQL